MFSSREHHVAGYGRLNPYEFNLYNSVRIITITDFHKNLYPYIRTLQGSVHVCVCVCVCMNIYIYILPLGDINIEAWSSGMGVGRWVNNPTL